jgi:exonuclease SbcC
MWQPKSLKIVNIISFKEQTFEFRNGKAILLVGENLDDSSQKGNGSGKSSLIESIALAFTGSSIRDVKTRELINNEAQEGEVELILFNTVTGEKLKIYRKIYAASTKSGEYKAWINGKEQSDRYSDSNMFNDFVWKTIGISKDDFFNFFLITKENYKPFLLVGDTKKKEIINRFSGADKVDTAFPLIENDSETLSLELSGIETELSQNQAKQEVLAEQLLQEEESISTEKHQEAINKKFEEIEQMQADENLINNHIEDHKREVQLTNDNVQLQEGKRKDFLAPFHNAINNAREDAVKYQITIEADLQPFKDAVELAELEVEAFEFTQDYVTEFKNIELKKKALNSRIADKKAELPKVKDQFADEIVSIGREEQELKQSLTEAEAELKENERFESEVAKSLEDSIECPKCKHHFSLRDENFNYEEAKAKLPEVQQAITEYKELIQELKNQINSDIQAKKQAINDKVVKAGESIKNEIEVLNKAVIDLGKEESELKQQQQEELNKKQVFINQVTTTKRELTNKEEEIADQRKRLQNKITITEGELTNKEHEFDNIINQLKLKVRRAELNLKGYEDELKSHQEAILQRIDQVEKMQAQEVDKSRVEKLTKDIETLVLAEEKIKARIDDKRKEKESVDAWEIHFKNFKSHLANKSIKNIQDYTNLFLESMGSNLAINIEGYRTLSNKKIKEQITTSVLRDGFDAGSYGKFSGGERGRIDICNIVGMQELITINAGHGKGLDMLLADEILESVDVTGMEAIIHSLQSLSKTIMLVSQNDINTLTEYTLTIQKRNKVSKILDKQSVIALAKAA